MITCHIRAVENCTHTGSHEQNANELIMDCGGVSLAFLIHGHKFGSQCNMGSGTIHAVAEEWGGGHHHMEMHTPSPRPTDSAMTWFSVHGASETSTIPWRLQRKMNDSWTIHSLPWSLSNWSLMAKQGRSCHRDFKALLCGINPVDVS